MEDQGLASIGFELPLADEVGQRDPKACVQPCQTGIQLITEEPQRQDCLLRQGSIRRDEMQLHHGVSLEK